MTYTVSSGTLNPTQLTLDKKLNSLIYRTLFYVNIHGSCKLSKNSPVFCGPSCILLCIFLRLLSRNDTEQCQVTATAPLAVTVLIIQLDNFV